MKLMSAAGYFAVCNCMLLLLCQVSTVLMSLLLLTPFVDLHWYDQLEVGVPG